MTTLPLIDTDAIPESEYSQKLVELHCAGCRTSVWQRMDDPGLPLCPECARASEEAHAHSCLSTVADLIRGCGEFAAWGCDERRALLRAHGIDVEPDRNDADRPTDEERDEIEARLETQAIEAYEDDREWTLR